MKKLLSLVLIMALVTMGLFAGGGKEEASAPAPVPTESAGTVTSSGNVKSAEVKADATYKDTVIIGIANDVNNLDPQGSNTDANMMVFYLTHERLVNIDPDTGKVIPALATEWTVSADGCV